MLIDYARCNAERLMKRCKMEFDSLLDPSAVFMMAETTAGRKQFNAYNEFSVAGVAFQRIRSEDLTPTTDPYLLDLGGKYQEDWNPFKVDPPSTKMPTKALLCNHPIAQRSFLVFPPVTWIVLKNCRNIEVRNPYGITIWDFVQAIQSQ